MQEDDSVLVERARRDPDAFGALYDRHVDGVYRFVHRRLGNVSLAEDVTAEVFVKALRSIAHYQDRGRPFSCWLYRIARTTLADQFRKTTAWSPLTESLAADGLDVEEQALRSLEMRGIWATVDRLPAKQAEAIRLVFGEDRSHAQAAAVLGKSEAAVKLLIHRGVRRLRKEHGAVPDRHHAAPRRSRASSSFADLTPSLR